MFKFVLIFLFALGARAAVLPEGRSFLYSNFSVSTSSALWLKGDEKHLYKGSDVLGNENQARRTYYQAGLKGYYGLGRNFQMGAGIRYGVVHLADGPVLGAGQGDTRKQISEISVEGHYQVFKKQKSSLDIGLRYLHPWKTTESHPEFLSFNDYTSFLELELRHLSSSSKFDLHSLIKYKKTLSSNGNNHYILEEKLLYKYNSNFSFGGGFDWLDTDQGMDVQDERFNNYISDTGFLPVWKRKENWFGLAAIGIYRWRSTHQFDAFIHRKISGRNTDIATTYGVGWGRAF